MPVRFDPAAFDAPAARRVLSDVLRIGEMALNNAPIDEELLNGVKREDDLNRAAKGIWKAIVEEFSFAESSALLAGIVTLESHHRWIGGSAASAIWIFQAMVDSGANPDDLDELSAWCVDNAWNPYVPFGTIATHGALCYSEFMAIRKDRAKVNQARRTADKERRENREKAMAQRAELAAQLRINGERKRIVEHLSNLTPIDRLQFMCDRTDLPLKFFPKFCAGSIGVSEFETVRREKLIELRERSVGRTSGPWRPFKRRLMAYLDGDDDEKGSQTWE